MKSGERSAVVHHAVPGEAVIAALEAKHNGLSQNEVELRLAKCGPNRLPEPASRSAVLRFMVHFHNILIYVLLAAAVITAGLGHLIDTGVILAVVLANATIGFIQEGRAQQAIKAIRKMLAPRTSVLREGKRRSLDSALVVPGDIVILEAGEKVPADLRLVVAKGLRIQEAILTGESVPVEKSTGPVAVEAVLGDRSCMAYSGTLVVGGAGRGVVVATGESSEIGRISGLLSRVETLTTPMIRQMDGFAWWLTVLILLVAAILLVFGYFVEHYSFPDLFHCSRRSYGGGNPGRTAGRPDDNHGDWRAGHGAAQCHRPPPAGDRDIGVGLSHLHGQDRDADTQ